ncbi:MAG: response regulator transcription factor [Sediminibacterium sp.]
MSNITCIIVEDEPLASKVLKDYVFQVPFLELKGTFKDAILASDFLRNASVDLMFLDIHLPKLKGMAFLRTLSKPPAVIITTAYHQYAVEGFDLNVTDYLLKPFDFNRFLMAVTKVKAAEIEYQKTQDTQGIKDYIFLNVERKRVKFLFFDLVYIESQREYIRIVTTKSEYICKMSTNEIEVLLPTHLFKRIHRSYIISVSKINSYTADMVEVNGVSIPIGRGFRNIIENL